MIPLVLKRSVLLFSFVTVSAATSSVLALSCIPFFAEVAELEVESVTIDGQAVELDDYDFDRLRLQTISPTFGQGDVTFLGQNSSDDRSFSLELDRVSEGQ